MFNTARLTVAASHLAVLQPYATRGVRRSANVVRYRTRLQQFHTEGAVGTAVVSLVRSGIKVRVLEGDRVWHPSVASDGVVVWNSRPARKTHGLVTVKVSL